MTTNKLKAEIERRVEFDPDGPYKEAWKRADRTKDLSVIQKAHVTIWFEAGATYQAKQDKVAWECLAKAVEALEDLSQPMEATDEILTARQVDEIICEVAEAELEQIKTMLGVVE